MSTPGKKPPQRPPQKTGPSMAQIWIATGLAVAVILGLAITISAVVRNNNEPSPPVVMAEGEAPAPQAPVTPEIAAPVTPDAPPPRPIVYENAPAGVRLDNLAGTLKVSTPAAPPGKRLSLDHTCYRAGLSLPVFWSGAPGRTQSLVMTVEEQQEGEEPFIKWLAYDIPASISVLQQGIEKVAQLENGVKQGRNDHNSLGYTGPCVPRGQVPYVLRLYALDTTLGNVPAELRFEELIPYINGHIIDAAAYEFIYYLRY